MTLLDYLQRFQPEELVPDGRHSFRMKTYSSLVVSDNGLWNWCGKSIGGKTALQYLCRVEGMPFMDAVRRLSDAPGLDSSLFQPAKGLVPPENGRRAEITLPTADDSNAVVARYLHGRKISGEVLRVCKEQELIYQNTNGGHTNCVFVGKDEQGNIRSASLRGCKGNFRGNALGSDKRYGFCIPAGPNKATIVEVYEAPIDALSGATLHLHQEGSAWRSYHYLAMGGFDIRTIEQFLSVHPQVREIHLCMDNDTPGRENTVRIMEYFAAKGYFVQDNPPPFGKDYNDTLQQVCCNRLKEQEPR